MGALVGKVAWTYLHRQFLLITVIVVYVLPDSNQQFHTRHRFLTLNLVHVDIVMLIT